MSKKRNEGFTLVELIIVIIILGILAALAIPQFTTSTDDAKDATQAANLAVLRNAVNLYYHQHNSTYPGFNDEDTGLPAVAAGMADAFVAQLTEYSDIDGNCQTTKAGTHPFGPYLMSRQIPDNPWADSAVAANSVQADDSATPLTADDATGWYASVVTGEIIPNNT